MGMFDQAARYACRVQPQTVARRLLRRVREKLELEQFHDTRTTPLPGQRDRTVDSVLSLRDLENPEVPALAILEFQAQADEDKLDTTLVSVAHMRADVRHGPNRKGRYRVFAALIFLCGPASESYLEMTLTDPDGAMLAGTVHKVLVWNVAEDDAAAALAEVGADFDRSWGLLFWFPLMRGAALKENIAAWLFLVPRVESKRHQADLFRIAIVFAELAGTLHEWREALKEADMQESQVILEWTADAERKGWINSSRETLLRQAGKRFKGEFTEEDKQMISTQESASVLRDWLDAVVESSTYADFRAVLRR